MKTTYEYLSYAELREHIDSELHQDSISSSDHIFCLGCWKSFSSDCLNDHAEHLLKTSETIASIESDGFVTDAPTGPVLQVPVFPGMAAEVNDDDEDNIDDDDVDRLVIDIDDDCDADRAWSSQQSGKV